MKQLLSILLLIGILAAFSSCQNADREPVEGLNGLEMYSDFIDNMTSGELQKVHYSFHTWFDFCSSESEVIKFRQTESGGRELLYRDRHPFVFWHWPAYDYYDGTNYYYKYDDEWFIDRFTKYDRVQQRDFIGIRERFFTGNQVLSDVVYRDGEGYLVHSVVQSTDRNTYYALIGHVDKDKMFRRIEIKHYDYNFDRGAWDHVGTYLFRYSHINEDRPVARPADLDLGNIQNKAALPPDAPEGSLEG
ncbi:hypothetical protein H8711_05575 [Clostridiaceae bacterium NSJ-31]|uniref:Lipoprotein n=1 Tax=Ligaoa zhengdingensis TaxID=2763658 RepID=A0A926DYS5_9FIRM|nr:hypothetical protein [Ligaoa zhengdingensis]MBC8546403.1 hypothetical protein [Ligaoa zhengdingensis]